MLKLLADSKSVTQSLETTYRVIMSTVCESILHCKVMRL